MKKNIKARDEQQNKPGKNAKRRKYDLIPSHSAPITRTLIQWKPEDPAEAMFKAIISNSASVDTVKVFRFLQGLSIFFITRRDFNHLRGAMQVLSVLNLPVEDLFPHEYKHVLSQTLDCDQFAMKTIASNFESLVNCTPFQVLNYTLPDPILELDEEGSAFFCRMLWKGKAQFVTNKMFQELFFPDTDALSTSIYSAMMRFIHPHSLIEFMFELIRDTSSSSVPYGEYSTITKCIDSKGKTIKTLVTGRCMVEPSSGTLLIALGLRPIGKLLPSMPNKISSSNQVEIESYNQVDSARIKKINFDPVNEVEVCQTDESHSTSSFSDSPLSSPSLTTETNSTNTIIQEQCNMNLISSLPQTQPLFSQQKQSRYYVEQYFGKRRQFLRQFQHFCAGHIRLVNKVYNRSITIQDHDSPSKLNGRELFEDNHNHNNHNNTTTLYGVKNLNQSIYEKENCIQPTHEETSHNQSIREQQQYHINDNGPVEVQINNPNIDKKAIEMLLALKLKRN